MIITLTLMKYIILTLYAILAREEIIKGSQLKKKKKKKKRFFGRPCQKKKKIEAVGLYLFSNTVKLRYS